ncbi:MAG: hypothetical protein ABTQ32_35505 [Myxococcaceae bacterium]
MVPVRIESDATDLQASSVQLLVSGAVSAEPLLGCASDGGFTDGGFCRVGLVRLWSVSLDAGRAQVDVTARANDDLLNQSVADAGTILVSRWFASFDGGSGVNGFSLLSSTLVVPKTGTSEVVLVPLDGGASLAVKTSYPPVRNVALGRTFIYVYEFETTTLFGVGQTFDSASLTAGPDWAPDVSRPNSQLGGPITAFNGTTENVAIVTKYGATWSVFDRSTRVSTGSSATSLQNAVGTVPLVAVGVGYKLYAAGLDTLYTLSGSSTVFGQLEPQQAYALPTPYTSISSMIGIVGGSDRVAGVGVGGGLFRTFSSSSVLLSPWAAQVAEPLELPIAGQGVLYFVRNFGSFSVACRSTQTSGSLLCAQVNLQDRTTSLALGAADTLYSAVVRTPGGESYIQVRAASTLALRYDIPLPGVVGGCSTLTPTCIGGSPVIGCVDTVGRLVFVSTDARGVDPADNWPMEGHDPSKTFNASTDLTPYACP